MTIGRNDPCPCGSGKKYKKCCDGIAGAVARLGLNEGLPQRVFKLTQPTQIRLISGELELYEISHELKLPLVRRIEQICGDDEIFKPLGWKQAEISQFQKVAESMVTTRTADFCLAIRDGDHLWQLLEAGQLDPKVFCCIYWNDIDQYIRYYRVQVVNLSQELMVRILSNFEGCVLLASLTRQLLELLITASANQWVITSTFNRLHVSLQKMAPGSIGTLTFGDFECFAMALTCPSKKSRRQLLQILGTKSRLTEQDSYFSVEYAPQTRRQLEIVRHVAKYFEQNTLVKGLPRAMDRIDFLYKYLCRFVHPSPLLFDPSVSEMEYSDDDVARSLRICAVDVIKNASLVFNAMFLAPEYVNHFFQDRIEAAIFERTSEPECMLEYQDPFLTKVLNTFTDIHTPISEGRFAELLDEKSV